MDFSLFVCLSFLAVRLVFAQEWGYLNSDETTQILLPEQWCDVWPLCCDGERQSPIDIVLDDVKRSEDLSPLNTEYGIFRHPTTINNGHTLVVFTNANGATMQGGNADGKFILEQLHFHWDNQDGFGSEHAIDGEHYNLEMHMVHYHFDFESVDDALENGGELAVIAVLFQLSDVEESNEGIHTLLDHLDDLEVQTDEQSLGVELDPDSFTDITKDTGFYTYEGSLTTPGCDEVVTWFILSEILPISAHDLHGLQNVTLAHQIQGQEHNWRGLNPLNDRKVFFHPGKIEEEAGEESEPIGVPVIITWVVAALVIAALVINYQYREWKNPKQSDEKEEQLMSSSV